MIGAGQFFSPLQIVRYPDRAEESMRKLLSLLLGLLTPTLLLAKPSEALPTSFNVHIYTFTSSSFPAPLLPSKAQYEAEKGAAAAPLLGWQGAGKKGEVGPILRQLSANGVKLEEKTTTFPLESEANAAAQWQKVQGELAALLKNPANAKPYFSIILSPGKLKGTLLHQVATGQTVFVGGRQTYLTLAFSATLRPGGYICHLFQTSDKPQAAYYGVIVVAE
jgi:hypothetical protein